MCVCVLSELCGDVENLELGDTVEYTLSKGKGNKVSAEKVNKVAAGKKTLPSPFPQLLDQTGDGWGGWADSSGGASKPAGRATLGVTGYALRGLWGHR